MTKFLTKSVLAATVAFLATPALAQSVPAGESSFDARAAIVKPVTLQNQTALDFGSTTMRPSLTSATVTVGDATGSVAVCSSTTMLTCSGGFPALFLVSGVQGETVQISIDNAPATLVHSNGTDTVDLDIDEVEDVPLDPTTGEGTFNVGGTITILSTTIAGTYAETVNIDANYL